MSVTVTERGWPAHFICANRCLFRRNTLIKCGERRIVVSTVGAFQPDHSKAEFDSIGAFDRMYETKAFEAAWEVPYWEADTSNEISFESPWQISGKEQGRDCSIRANEMHDRVVRELVARLLEEDCDWWKECDS